MFCIVLALLICFASWSVIIFNCLILCKQTSNIIIINIFIAICNTFSFTKNCKGVLLETRHFLFDLDLLMFMSASCAKIIFLPQLIILLRPLSAQALFENGRFNTGGKKNKQEYISKPERNACKDYPFQK